MEFRVESETSNCSIEFGILDSFDEGWLEYGEYRNLTGPYNSDGDILVVDVSSYDDMYYVACRPSFRDDSYLDVYKVWLEK